MKRITLCTGLLLRGDRVALVRCRYEGEPEALWTLPGGRQEAGETIGETVVREFREETGLTVNWESLAYASESIDDERELHVVNYTFNVVESDPSVEPRPQDPAVIEAKFVSATQAPGLLRADVMRIPVGAALSCRPHPRYFAFRAKDVAIPFLRGPAGEKDL